MAAWPARVASRYLERSSGLLTALIVLLVGALAPILTYHFDWLLRARVQYWVDPRYRLVGVIEVLEVQARSQPWSLVALIGAPVGAVAFVVIAWMRHRARERTTDRKRIGGWLALFMLGMCAGIFVNVRGIYRARHDIAVSLGALPHLAHVRSPTLVLLILARHLLAGVMTAACLLGLWLIVRRHRRTPAYWTILCAVLAAADVYANAIGAWERRVGARIDVALFPKADFGMTAASSALVALAWCVYSLRSRRVLETFGSRGLDLFVERAALPELAAASTSETPPR